MKNGAVVATRPFGIFNDHSKRERKRGIRKWSLRLMNSASRCERSHEERSNELINSAERTTKSGATIIEQR